MDGILQGNIRGFDASVKQLRDQAAEYAVQMDLPFGGRPSHVAVAKDAREDGRHSATQHRPRVAEFFAGIGLVRRALELTGFDVVFANDIAPVKHKMYTANFDASHFLLGDICQIEGSQVPDIDLATASFPCTDLSLAGNRRGLDGQQSGMFWEFARVLDEMGMRRPAAVLLENVPSFASSHGGKDLYEAIKKLNSLGYWCDLLVMDARHFVPQSRPRLFVIGSLTLPDLVSDWCPSEIRPNWLRPFVTRHPDLKLMAFPLPLLPQTEASLADVVEHLPPNSERWWESDRLERFLSSLSARQEARLSVLWNANELVWATAFRRTRGGRPVWEIRQDRISGCLRTARGGSSKQAIVQAGFGEVRVRWMLPVEYARLQGASSFIVPPTISEGQAMHGFGDAVCVPVVSWLSREYLRPLLERQGVSNSYVVR